MPRTKARSRIPSFTLSTRSPAHLRVTSAASNLLLRSIPGAEEIEVTLITETGQTSYEVERDSPRIDLGALASARAPARWRVA